MKIEIRPDGAATWSIMARTDENAPPAVMGLKRTAAQIEYLLHGVLTDHDHDRAGAEPA